MSFSGLLSLFLSCMLSPRPPPQRPLGPMCEPGRLACAQMMDESADQEEGGNDDPEGECDSITWLAHGMDGQVTRDPVMGFCVGGRTRIVRMRIHGCVEWL